MSRITRRKLLAAAGATAAIQTTGCRKSETPEVAGPTKAERFAEKITDDVAAGLRAPLSYIGERLGIFRAMADSNAVTVDELARKTGLNARYLREWLGTMVAAEYIEYQPKTKRYFLPPDHAAVLTDEESPVFQGGSLEGLIAVMVTPKVLQAFRTGKGLAYSDYPPEVFEGIARGSAPSFKHELVQKWIPAMPEVEARLRAGGTAADVGCGFGWASIVMAKAFPKSKFWGYDSHAPSIEAARAKAKSQGVSDRVTFEVVDGTRLPARQFDFISSFDVLHDSADPLAIVRSVRAALAPEGAYMASEPNLSPSPDENINPTGRLFYAASTLYCMSVSLGQGGAGIGADVNADMVKRWGEEAGFSRIRTLPTYGALEMRI